MSISYKKTSVWMLSIIAFMTYILGNFSYAAQLQAPATLATPAVIKKSPSQPDFDNDAVIAWVNDALPAIFTYDYKNYKTQLNDSVKYFTTDGWNSYSAALKASGNLEATVTKQLSVSITKKGTAKITKQGIENGQYVWRVQMPVTVTYAGDKQNIDNPYIVNLLLVQMKKPKPSIGINQLIVTMGS